MASKRFEKGSSEFLMFADFYKLVQEYYIPEDADQYYENLKEKSYEFLEKYKDTPLSRNLIIAINDYIAEQAFLGDHTTTK